MGLLSRRYLVDCGAIKPLCDLLSTPDVRIVTVALEGLENILKVSRRLLVLQPGTAHCQCLRRVLQHRFLCSGPLPPEL
jgi:hypothetical protein